MSLRSQIQQAVQAGIAAIDDLAELATYQSVLTPSYEPSTGVIAQPTWTIADVPIVFTSFSRMEIDGAAVRAEDLKAIVATRDLTPVPTINDTITRANGTVWSVIGVTTDPAGAAWVLQIRRP
jgi:hypothetical protein